MELSVERLVERLVELFVEPEYQTTDNLTLKSNCSLKVGHMNPTGQESDRGRVFSSPQLLRRANLTAVLQYAWDVEAFTATDAMGATGLTRSTALGLADDLVTLGWVRELADSRALGERAKGRPARRYAFEPEAGYVVGVDAGLHRVTACVGDLRGRLLSRSTRRLDPTLEDPEFRVAQVRETIAQALVGAKAGRGDVLVTVVGVPAPADARGRSPVGLAGYWGLMNPGFADVLEPGRTVVVDNDANLAAIAEGSVGAGVGVSSFVALLSGERFGAGLVVDGSLLRGLHGGAGEMHLLDLVDGVGSADGLASLAREWGREAVALGTVPEGSAMLRRAPDPPELVDVVEAAQGGEPAAAAVVERLAARLARVNAVLAGLLDVERIIVCGAMAAAAVPVIASAADRLPTHADLPVPQLVASTLGADGVTVGAVHKGLSIVRTDPLDFDLPIPRTPPAPARVSASTGAGDGGTMRRPHMARAR